MRRARVMLLGLWMCAFAPSLADAGGVSVDQAVIEEVLDPKRAVLALPRLREAAISFRAAGDRRGELTALELLGTAQSTLGELRRAIETYRRIVDLARAVKDRDMEAFGLREIGLAHTNLGEAAQALEPARQSLAIALSDRTPWLEAKTHNLLGWAYWNLGEYEKTLEHCRRGLAVGERYEAKGEQGWALNILGLAYWSLGEAGLARAALERALPLFREVGDPLGKRLTIHYLGLVAFSEGDIPGTRRFFQEALRLSQEARDRQTEALAHDNIGRLASLQGDVARAEEELERALALWRRVGDRRGEARSLENLGRTLAAAGRVEEARRNLLRALAIRHELGDRASEARSLTALADMALRADSLEEAGERLEPALALLESVRAGVSAGDLRASFLAVNQSPFELNVELAERLFRRSPTRDAALRVLQAVERARARTLLEAVNELRPLASADSALTPPPGVSVSHHLERLDAGTAIVSFSVLPDQILAIVLAHGGVRVVRLATKPVELSERIADYVDLIAGDDVTNWVALGNQLFRDLVEPWSRGLGTSVKRLVVIPDGFLHRLPFEALVVRLEPTRYLVEDLSISYGPSIAVLEALGRQGESASDSGRLDLLALTSPEVSKPLQSRSETARLYEREGFRNTPLPYSRREGEIIARCVGAQSVVLAGAEASERRLERESLSRYRIVHFATHGIVDEKVPSRSALVLSPGRDPGDEDGFLQAREIYGLRLTSDLVVLSGCQTARGRLLKGEGMRGLAQAFFHAGARSMVASLWNVPDSRTADLMEIFYRFLAVGETKAEALRQAKLAFLRDDRTRAPRFWAAFVLLGEGERPIPLHGPPLWRRVPPLAWVCGGLILILLAVVSRRGARHRLRVPAGAIRNQ